MIVICIDDKHLASKKKTRLTLNKKYEVLSISYVGYRLVNDEGELETFVKDRFIKLQDKRISRLKELGI